MKESYTTYVKGIFTIIIVSKDPESFLMVISRLDPEHKQRCFDEILNTLAKGGQGPNRVRDHLMEGV